MKLKLTIDGKTYEVDVDVSEPAPPQPGWVAPIGRAQAPASAPTGAAAPAPPAADGAPVDETKVCRSPFAGTVTRVAAQAGQKIQTNDVLVVLEAMKMEAVITSPRDGEVAKINVKAGDAVQSGQVLVEFT